MEKHRGRMGFAMIELALAVGIMAVLAGIGFAAEGAFARNLTKTEYDGLAKEIFVAAQNHLAMAASQNFMGMTDFGETDFELDDEGKVKKDEEGNAKKTGAYYFYVNPADYSNDVYDNTVLNVILPQYAIDEVLRARGQFFLRYHPDSAQALDVFYWQETGGRFSYRLDKDKIVDAYADFKNTVSKDKTKLKNYGSENSVIGYYGGLGDAEQLKDLKDLTRGEPLKPLSIVVDNGDKLTVKVTNPNSGVTVKLIVTGKTSGETKVVDVPADGDVVVLDDITTSGQHFSELFRTFIPGEDITVQAVAYSSSQLTNVAYSSEQTTNSLFGDGTDTENWTAKISNIRHLENLSTEISGVNDPYDN